MKLVIQRVSEASVKVDEEIVGSIQKGLLVLIGFKDGDEAIDLEKKIQKLIRLRIFNDENGKMNNSLVQENGSVLVVSQFTLYANTEKGNRPSFIHAARPEIAIPLYEQFIALLRAKIGSDKVATGIFGADMKVSLVNDGPVTIILE